MRVYIDDVETSTVARFSLTTTVCCLAETSENDCLQNDPFVEFWQCLLESAGCPEEEEEDGIFKCDDKGGRSIGSTSGAAASATTTVGHAYAAVLTCALFMPLLVLLGI